MSGNRNRVRRPTHPGAILREDVLPALKMSVAEVADALGVTRQTLHRVVSERAAISPDMAVRIGKFGTVSPKGLAGCVDENGSPRHPSDMDRVDIVDLKPERNAIGHRIGFLLQEYRKFLAIVQCDGPSFRHLEFDRQAQRRNPPGARAIKIAHRQIEMVELHHVKRSMKPPPRTRLPAAPS